MLQSAPAGSARARLDRTESRGERENSGIYGTLPLARRPSRQGLAQANASLQYLLVSVLTLLARRAVGTSSTVGSRLGLGPPAGVHVEDGAPLVRAPAAAGSGPRCQLHGSISNASARARANSAS